MTDHEDNRTAHPLDCDCDWCQAVAEPVTQRDLRAESSAITSSMMRHMAKMAEAMRDHMYHLNKTHTLCVMAAELRAHGGLIPVKDAEELYCEVERRLRGGSITGSIPQ